MEPNVPVRRPYVVRPFEGPAPGPHQAVPTYLGPPVFQPAPPEDSGLDFGAVRDALRRGIWVIVGTCVVVVALVTGYTLLLPSEYESSALVFINMGGQSQWQTSPASSVPGAVQPRRNLSNEIGRLRFSQDIRNRVGERLIESERVLGNGRYFPILAPIEGQDSVTVTQVAARLYEQVTFNGLGDQDMIAIVAASTVPEEAARIANYYAEEYERISLEESRASVVAARTFLEGQVSKLSGELDGIEDQIVAFSRNQRVPQQGEGGGVLVSRYAAYQAQRDQAQMLLEQERKALEVITDELAQVDPAALASPPPSTSGLETEVAAYQQRVAELRLRAETYYANDPSLEGDEDRVPELREVVRQIEHYEGRRMALERELASALAANPKRDESYASELQVQRVQRQSSIRGLEAQLQALTGQIQVLDSQVQGIPRQTVELAQLNRRREMLADWYASFLRDLQQVLLAEEAELGYVTTVSAAGVPVAPVRPNLTQNVVLAILLGLGFGVGLAFVRHASKQLIAGPEDVQQRGFRVLGVIPSLEGLVKEERKGRDAVRVGDDHPSTRLLTALDPWSPVTENFRFIRTSLDHVPVGTPKIVLVTSAEMGEGKTLTSTNLAVAMANGGRRTLLIDADLRRPSTHRLLKGKGGGTLADILGSGTMWKEVFDEQDLITDVPDLFLLPAGLPDVPPSELLGSSVLLELLNQVRADFDIVIIDSPPVLVATDVLLLSQLADATVLVVGANRTDVRAFEHTLTTLDDVGSSVTGIIINRYDGGGRSKYNYGYTYDYTKDYHGRRGSSAKAL